YYSTTVQSADHRTGLIRAHKGRGVAIVKDDERTPMAQPEHLAILVLGSGAGGKLIAWHMAGAGQRTAVVERKWIGGACPNIACMAKQHESSSAKVDRFLRTVA